MLDCKQMSFLSEGRKFSQEREKNNISKKNHSLWMSLIHSIIKKLVLVFQFARTILH